VDKSDFAAIPGNRGANWLGSSPQAVHRLLHGGMAVRAKKLAELKKADVVKSRSQQIHTFIVSYVQILATFDLKLQRFLH
jgi:hypothetical protein